MLKNVKPEKRSDAEDLDERLRPALVSFFARRVQNHAEAEDLTQEVFVRMAQVGETRLRSAEAYMFQVAANLLRDRARREKVRGDYRQRVLLEDEGADLLDPFRIAAGKSDLDMIAVAIAALPEKTRRIFVLYRIENVEKQAIAGSFGCSVRSVEMHIKQAMETLFEAMERKS